MEKIKQPENTTARKVRERVDIVQQAVSQTDQWDAFADMVAEYGTRMCNTYPEIAEKSIAYHALVGGTLSNHTDIDFPGDDSVFAFLDTLDARFPKQNDSHE